MIPNHPDPKAIRQAILEGDTQAATEYAQAAQGAGLPAVQAVEPFIAAIRHAGELFEQGDFFLPQLLLASKAMKAALAVLFPSSDESDAQSALSHGTVVAGTVQHRHGRPRPLGAVSLPVEVEAVMGAKESLLAPRLGSRREGGHGHDQSYHGPSGAVPPGAPRHPSWPSRRRGGEVYRLPP